MTGDFQGSRIPCCSANTTASVGVVAAGLRFMWRRKKTASAHTIYFMDSPLKEKAFHAL
jgi:hypothetical protein